jgi:hypothetical protein
VSWLELRNQPESYRGKSVEFSGRIRGARIQPTSSVIAGIDQYVELWVQPDEASTIPYCVYALQMPTEFPTLTDQLSTMDVSATIVGLFFKNRTYLTEEGRTQVCPVVLTLRPVVTEAALTSTGGEPPSITSIAVTIAIVTLLAGWIAFRVYRATLFSRRRTSPNVPSTLRELENDPRVESVRERLARFGESVEAAPNTSDERPHSV